MSRILRNKNAPPLADLVQEYIGTAYDTVKAVYDALPMILEVAAAIDAGTLDDFLADTDIDTLAKLNAILTDAVLLSEGDIDTLAKLNSYVTDATIASQAYVDQAVTGLYDHKGSYDATTNTPDLDVAPSGIKKSDAYTVSVAGTFYAVAVEAGDVLIANQDDPTASTHWTIVNRNIDSSAFATAAQGATADTAVQPLDNVSSLTNDAGYTDDQTGAEIKAAYEAEADTNAYTDAEKTKLGLIEASATADQTGSEIESLYNSQVAAVSQVEAEAGTEVGIRRWSPLRVAQAIAALGGGGGGGGMTGLYKTINYTLVADDLVYSEDGLTHTLPATPSANDKCSIWDVSDNAGNNAITILRNGKTIMGGADDFSLNMNGGRVDFLYNGTTWLYSYVVQTIQPSTTIVRTVSQWIPADDMYPRTGYAMGSIAEIPATVAMIVRGAATTTADGAYKAIALPDNLLANSPWSVEIFWSPSSTNTGNVAWRLWYAEYNAGVTPKIADTGVGTIYPAGGGVADALQINMFATPTNLTNKRMLGILVDRNGDDAADTFTGTANFAGIMLRYQIEETLTASVTNNPSAVTRIVSGTTDTLLNSDNGKEIIYTSGSGIAVTLPATFAEGWNCVITQAGAGVPTVTRSGAETINGNTAGVSPAAQWKGMYLSKYAATAWIAKY